MITDQNIDSKTSNTAVHRWLKDRELMPASNSCDKHAFSFQQHAFFSATILATDYVLDSSGTGVVISTAKHIYILLYITT